MRNSNLNLHLAERNLVPHPACSCGAEIEGSLHYLLECPLFSDQRREMNTRIQQKTNLPIDIKLILYGNSEIEESKNVNIFLAVQNYIKETKRFAHSSY